MIFTWAAFLATSLGLIIIINAKVTRQEQEILIKFLAPAHGFFAMLISYGIAITLAAIARFWKQMPRAAMAALCAACLALPFVTYTRNWELCSLTQFDFGYQFGYRMFKPGGGYDDMTPDAVLFGGTDPGRFVPTYMIFCQSFVDPEDRFVSPWMRPNMTDEERAIEKERMTSFDRRDVYIITQNALADQTYMNYIRDHYGHTRPDPANPDTLKKFLPWQQRVFHWGWKWLGRSEAYPKNPIRIPTPEDSSRAFEIYVREVQEGVRPNHGDLIIKDGRIQVQGALAVMEINGILTKWIHDWNKDKHDFFIEESYPIAWMNPYLRPAGVIMKIEKEPLPSPQQDPQLWTDIVAKDTAYWDTLVEEFLAREEFRRSADAKKNFSKLRSAIAGIYLHRNMLAEAEYALLQAVRLCPEGSEGGYRLAELYLAQRRYADARGIMENNLLHDPYNESVSRMLERIDELIMFEQRRETLVKKMEGAHTISDVLDLVAVSLRLNRHNEVVQLSNRLLANPDAPPQTALQLGLVLAQFQRHDLARQCFDHYTKRQPSDPRGWIELGWCAIQLRQAQEGYDAWAKAVELGRGDARKFLREDERFKSFWQNQPPNSAFLDLVKLPALRPGNIRITP